MFTELITPLLTLLGIELVPFLILVFIIIFLIKD